jgi:hypothetical protein
MSFPTIIKNSSTGTEYVERTTNLIEGSGVSVTVTDTPASERVDVTIATGPLDLAPQALSASYSIPAGHNALAVDKLAIAAGVTLTIPAGATLRIL